MLVKEPTIKKFALSRLSLGVLCGALCIPASTALAEEQLLEEVIVTARQQAEGLQDVPVTITAMTEADLDRYNITNLIEAAKLVPNMFIQQAGSGNGTIMRLRGIGSSDISAAFDHSIAINIDGVVVNRGRFIVNSYLDMNQLEVLKGPQSLYFGKSATAGVVSVTTNDPGDEFEFQIGGGVETEHDGTFYEMVLSAPLSDTFGARLAMGASKNDELKENYAFGVDPRIATNGGQEFFGDESTNARLTLVWNPTDNFSAKLKYNYSDYENDAGWMWADQVCPQGTPQPTAVPSASAAFRLFNTVDDCQINGNASRVYLDPGLRGGLPNGFDDGRLRLEQETDFISLTMNWDVSDSLSVTSVTGWVDFDHWELDDYSNGAGVFGGLHNNIYKSLSQELRIASNYDGALNFQAGLYWQDTEQEFDAYQYAFNLGVMPNIFGPAYAIVGGDPNAAIIGPDPVTGNMYDYNKHHFLDSDAKSAFLALYWDVTEDTEVTVGARWTDEEKVGRIEIPYVHAGALLFGFGGPPEITGLNFDDSNVSPEFAINHHLNSDISVFFAYKEAFKSGGIDNSALPTAALNPANNGGDFSFLLYDSEESDGYEVGLKANLLNNAMRFNATAFTYEYKDLQVQLFDSNIIQFQTFNASALESKGVEFDMLWNTDVEGLSVRAAWAFTDTGYSEDFINATGQNLKGLDGAGSADSAGNIGFTLDRELTGDWRYSFSFDARYTGDYAWTATLDPFRQESFILTDAAISFYSSDNRHEISLIGRNLGDEFYAISGGATPGACPQPYDAATFSCAQVGANLQDQVAYTALGRQFTIRYKFSM